MLRRLGPLLLLTAAVTAQRGDRAGEDQVPLPADLVVPPAPVLEVGAAQATLRLAAGFAIAPYAAEPLVGDPVAAVFDAAGRLWVVEMRGYMNDLDARGEDQPTGQIAVLHDDDRDGRADRRSVFADGLVLPRAVLPLRGGALVIAPPHLWWCEDADGDLVCERRTAVAGGFEAGLENPEHSGNGLLWGLDHRLHLANDARLFGPEPPAFAVERGAGGGQWGVTMDDRGRTYFNYNEDWLRCDLVPGRYGPRAQATGGLPQLNARLVAGSSVWPIRVTPGVNRGYQPGRLRGGVLAIHTAVCGPHVYRGGVLPGCDGDVFVCEPAGNLVRRLRVTGGDGWPKAENVYEAERAEFLASTDERFRPVNLLTGPDGALYVVDMYRGVIQHRNFVTSFLRRQIEARGLVQPVGMGRIWRITGAAAGATAGNRAGAKDTVPPTPASADDAALVRALADDLGARRDLALRELVQRQSLAAVAGVRALAADPRPAVRIAALSALAGLRSLSATEVRAALRDADAGVLAFALQHAAPFLAAGDRLLWTMVEQLVATAPLCVQWQLVLTLGDVAAGDAAGRWRTANDALWLAVLRRHGDDHGVRAAIAAAAGADAVPGLLAAYANLGSPVAPGNPVAPGDAAVSARRRRCCATWRARAARARQPAVLAALFATAAALPAAAALPVLRGVRSVWPTSVAWQPGAFHLPHTTHLATMAQSADEALRAAATDLLAGCALLADAPPAQVAELSAAEATLVRAGERVFVRTCASCHQLDGNGMAGLAPPLRDSEWVTGSVANLVRIALHGVRGPIAVAGSNWNLEMPGQRHLTDDELAAVLGYLRRGFGHVASVPTPAEVATVRAVHRDRSEPWTAAELSTAAAAPQDVPRAR